MVQLEKVLCPIDFSESSTRSLIHAAALAKWFGAQLTVLHVVETFEPVRLRGHFGDPVTLPPVPREEVLAEMRRTLGAAGVSSDATLVAEAGDTPTAIVGQAASSGADLIVMGTHGRRGFRRLLLGSVTETVLREAPCPVLTVPPDTPPSVSEVVALNHILCPVDFSSYALQALTLALDLARQADARVTLLYVVEWLAEEEPRRSAHFNVPEYRSYIAADAEERLRLLAAERSQSWSKTDTRVAAGRPHREILRTAGENPVDLIVMGAQGRGGVGLALFGSTTQQVLRGATCPVLTVRG